VAASHGAKAAFSVKAGKRGDEEFRNERKKLKH
jgi:hypothetical protein